MALIVSVFMFKQGMPAPQASPVFVCAAKSLPCYLELRGDLFACEPYHIVDAQDLSAVIELVKSVAGKQVLKRYFQTHGVMSGQSIEIKTHVTSALVVECGYMNAGRRIALAIPLHPDQMTREDWQALPGIGGKLSLAIEEDRRLHGSFSSFEQLDRVRGIGHKSLARWEPFFTNSKKKLQSAVICGAD
ncbi:MAG: helix-hairpin-helix domain-containing protein [Thermodesulfobacteriota bacterium]|nr:helix-hairpin-helix domain-containing protein [Thermodesulfobacteriota bacterium]